MFKKPDRKILTVILLAACFISANSKGYSQSRTTIKDVNEALSLAMKNNSEIVKANIDKLIAEEKVSEVYSENLVPTISLNSRYSRAFKKQVFDIFGEKIEIGSDNSFTNSIDVTEALPILGTPVFSGIRIAEYFLKTQQENLIAVQDEVKYNVKRAYYGVQLTKAVVDVNKLTLENAQNNFNTVSAKYRNGVATEFDYLRSKVKFDNVRPELSKAERNLEISLKILSDAIGLKVNEAVDVTGELIYDSTEFTGNTDQIISKIAEENVAVRLLGIGKKINEEFVTVNKANYLPKLYLFGQYAIGTQENDGRPISQYRFINTANAGLGLTWDLNLFRNSYKVKQSELEVKKNDEQIRDLKQKLRLRSESAIIALIDAKERISTMKGTMRLAERSVELANASYSAGVLNQIDVQDAELSLYNSRLGFQQSVYDYQVAKAELERLLGN